MERYLLFNVLPKISVMLYWQMCFTILGRTFQPAWFPVWTGEAQAAGLGYLTLFQMPFVLFCKQMLQIPLNFSTAIDWDGPRLEQHPAMEKWQTNTKFFWKKINKQAASGSLLHTLGPLYLARSTVWLENKTIVILINCSADLLILKPNCCRDEPLDKCWPIVWLFNPLPNSLPIHSFNSANG